jgi:hypothetical protein
MKRIMDDLRWSIEGDDLSQLTLSQEDAAIILSALKDYYAILASS